jgi:hypothetical protein
MYAAGALLIPIFESKTSSVGGVRRHGWWRGPTSAAAPLTRLCERSSSSIGRCQASRVLSRDPRHASQRVMFAAPQRERTNPLRMRCCSAHQRRLAVDAATNHMRCPAHRIGRPYVAAGFETRFGASHRKGKAQRLRGSNSWACLSSYLVGSSTSVCAASPNFWHFIHARCLSPSSLLHSLGILLVAASSSQYLSLSGRIAGVGAVTEEPSNRRRKALFRIATSFAPVTSPLPLRAPPKPEGV